MSNKNDDDDDDEWTNDVQAKMVELSDNDWICVHFSSAEKKILLFTCGAVHAFKKKCVIYKCDRFRIYLCNHFCESIRFVVWLHLIRRLNIESSNEMRNSFGFATIFFFSFHSLVSHENVQKKNSSGQPKTRKGNIKKNISAISDG